VWATLWVKLHLLATYEFLFVFRWRREMLLHLLSKRWHLTYKMSSSLPLSVKCSFFTSCPLGDGCLWARVNQQPPMHQLAVLSTGWVAFFHSAPNGVHHSLFLFPTNHCTFFSFFFGFWLFFLGPNLTHSYLAHFPTHKYCTNLVTLFIIPY
jgi:hypothetical protein